MQRITGNDVLIECSPVHPVVLVFGEIGHNYGMMLLQHEATGLRKVGHISLTHQIVSRIVFSPDGRYILAAAMSASHIFIFKVSIFTFLYNTSTPYRL